ncbi:MAG: two-component system response regulator [delta proteobacterium ML8_F1]|nr:MAG: two-component system response regulator [delta proteobacterium ML8_F1]
MLVIEDEIQIRNILKDYLVNSGYEVALAADGFEGLREFVAFEPDLVVLDVMMPGISGFEVLEEIRRTDQVPVIMLTARQEEVDRLEGFDLGADDYVGKPFSPRELVRRVEAVIKRTYQSTSKTKKIYYGPFILDKDANALKKAHREIPLTTKEYQILEVFFNHIGIVLTRDQLIELAFDDLYEGFDRTIDTHIKRIRAKIEEDPRNPRYLKTRYGAGYLFGGDGDDL